MSSQKNDGPNWVEVWTLTAVLLGIGGSALKFAWFDWPLANLERREREVEVARTVTEAVSLEGQVLAPDLFVVDGEHGIPLCPVFLNISNDGDTPARLKKIEMRVFTASLRDVSILTQMKTPSNGIVLASGDDSRQKKPERPECIVGIIDPDSDNWVELAQLAREMIPAEGVIPPKQRRVERLHLIAPTNYSSVITKIEMTVFTEQATHKWYGFANPAMCAPAFGESLPAENQN
jgi:hypothetical protein